MPWHDMVETIAVSHIDPAVDGMVRFEDDTPGIIHPEAFVMVAMNPDHRKTMGSFDQSFEDFLFGLGQTPPRVINGVSIEYQCGVVGEPVQKLNKFFPEKVTRSDMQITDDNGFHFSIRSTLFINTMEIPAKHI